MHYENVFYKHLNFEHKQISKKSRKFENYFYLIIANSFNYIPVCEFENVINLRFHIYFIVFYFYILLVYTHL